MIVMNKKMLSLLQNYTFEKCRLSTRLDKICKEGFVEIDNCVLLRSLYESNDSYDYKMFEDLTAFECFINGIHIEDFCSKQIVENAFKFSSRIFEEMNKKCFIILSFPSDKECSFSFHTKHLNEPDWLDYDTLDKYPECICVIS